MNDLVTTNIHNFSPDEVMARLGRGDWTGVWEYLRQLLENSTATANMQFNVALQRELGDEVRRSYVQNFGALAGELILALLMDPASKIPDKSFVGLILAHETLHNLFSLFGLGETDALVRTFLDKKGKLTDTDQKRVLLLLSLGTALDVVEVLKRVDAKYRIPAVTAYLSTMKIAERAVYQNKVKLYALRRDIDRTHSDHMVFTLATFAYFTCSYMNNPDKHLLKENVNNAVGNYLQEYQREFRTIRRMPRQEGRVVVQDGKPVLLVVLELYLKNHAMNRSWGDWIHSLGSAFSVVLAVPAHKYFETMDDRLGTVIPFADMADLAKLAHDVAPDMVVYPSVGMEIMGIIASNMRFAPVQIMCLGHPATSMSKEIDFVYGQSALYHPDAFPRDRYLADDSPYRFVANLTRDQVLSVPVKKREKDDEAPLRVAIVGSNLKVSYPFLALLKEIQDESPFPIQFDFHMGTVGIDSLYFEQSLARHFKCFTYRGYQSYDQYLTALREADMMLNPFPFGHTNTIIDTLLLGKPCVGLRGVEPASRTETVILDMVGLTDLFVADNETEYKKKFFGFAQKIRAGENEFFDRGAVYDHLYGEHKATDFGEILKWVWDNHAKMMASSQKYFKVLTDLT